METKTKVIEKKLYDPNVINFHKDVIRRLQNNESLNKIYGVLEVLNKKLWEYIPRKIWSDDEFTRVINEIITELKLWRKRNPLSIGSEGFNRQLAEEAETHGFQSILVQYTELLEDIERNGWVDDLCDYAGYKSQRDE